MWRLLIAADAFERGDCGRAGFAGRFENLGNDSLPASWVSAQRTLADSVSAEGTSTSSALDFSSLSEPRQCLARRTFLACGRAARFCYRFAAMRACKTERRKFPPNVFSKFGRAHTLNFPVARRAQLFFQGINFAANPFQLSTHCRASPRA